jgi:hypothetical protein
VGFQWVGKVGFSISRNLKHDFALLAGPVLRYESSSQYTSFSTFFPGIGTGLDVPAYYVTYAPSQRVLVAAGLVQLYYRRQVTGRLYAGLGLAGQLDSLGDLIWHIPNLSVGLSL